MGAEGRQPRALAAEADQVRDRVTGDRSDRSESTKEECAGGNPSPITTEIGRQRLTDVHRQWKPFLSTALAADDDLSAAPVDVIELDRRHFTRAQPETSEQHEHGIGAPSGGGASVAGAQEPGDLLRIHGPRERGEAPAR